MVYMDLIPVICIYTILRCTYTTYLAGQCTPGVSLLLKNLSLQHCHN